MRSNLRWTLAAGLVAAAYTLGVVGIPSHDGKSPVACGDNAKKKKDKKDEKRS